eukprot:scaffold400616_cov55-Attheya_sp.AAC.1
MAPRAMILGLKYFKAMMESSGHVPQYLFYIFLPVQSGANGQTLGSLKNEGVPPNSTAIVCP